MARLFDDGATEYLEIEQAALAGAPLAITCLFNTNDMDNSQALVFILDKDVDNHWLGLFITANNDRLNADSQSEIGGVRATTTSSYLVNTWHHGCGIWATVTDRRAFLDGGSKGTDVNSITPANLDRTSIGRLGRATPAVYMSGMIAEVAIWDLSSWPGATDSDKADAFEKILPSLAKLYTPKHYPLGLVAYWPLIRGLNDKFGGYNLTASGTVVAAHPNIIQPYGIL